MIPISLALFYDALTESRDKLFSAFDPENVDFDIPTPTTWT